MLCWVLCYAGASLGQMSATAFPVNLRNVTNYWFIKPLLLLKRQL
jgi:hypothetical protein